MADKKISALTAAATPLAGTEVLPIVQSGSTVKVTVGNLTAGRDVAASNLLPTGYLYFKAPDYTTTTRIGFGNPGRTGDAGYIDYIGNGDFTGQMAFGLVTTAANVPASELMRLTPTGRLGIGVTSPQFQIHLGGETTGVANGQIGLGNLAGTPFGRIEGFRVDASFAGELRFFTTASLGTQVQALTIGSTQNVTVNAGNLVVGTAGKGITTSSAINLNLGTNNTVTAIKIDTSNNVGINTPGNPNARFEVFDGAVRFGNASGNGFLFADGTATLAGSLSNHPLHFYTNNTKRAEIDTSGNFSAGVGALATNATNGFLYIPTCPGIPTGTPTTKTGLAPLVVDSTNNKLYVYIGGAWQAMN